ncbi:MAG: hypothetical protein ABIY71_11260 [Flavobacteriales bacterium]
MLFRFFLFAIPLLLSTAVSAQGFQLQYGGANLQEAVATINDAQGYSTLVRETYTSGDRVRIRLLRTDLQGQNQQWYDVGITGACFVHAAVPSTDGKILLCGSRIAPGRSDQDALIAKISHTGEVLWSWTSNTPDEQEELRDLKQTTDGGIIACGTHRGNADSDVLLVRTDATGDLQWQQHYGTSGEESGNGVAFDNDGYMIAGRIGGFSGDLDAYIVRTDSDGNELWWQSWGGVKNDLLKGIVQSASMFVMAGYTDSYGPQIGAQHVRSVYMIAMNAAGDTLWTRTIGELGAACSAEDIQVTTNGDFLLAGQSGNSHLTNGMVMRVSDTGNQLWKRTYNLGNEDLLHGLTLLPDGGFIAAGRSFGPGSMQAVLVRKNASGN